MCGGSVPISILEVLLEDHVTLKTGYSQYWIVLWNILFSRSTLNFYDLKHKACNVKLNCKTVNPVTFLNRHPKYFKMYLFSLRHIFLLLVERLKLDQNWLKKSLKQTSQGIRIDPIDLYGSATPNTSHTVFGFLGNVVIRKTKHVLWKAKTIK